MIAEVSLDALHKVQKALRRFSAEMSGLASKASKTSDEALSYAQIKIRSLEYELAKAKSDVRKLEGERDTIINNDIPFHTRRIDEERDRCGYLQGQEDRIKAQIASAKAKLSSLSSSAGPEKARAIGQLDTQIASLNSKLTNIQSQKAEAHSQKLIHQGELSAVNQRLRDITEEIDKAKTRVRCLDQKLASLRQAFSRLKNELQVYMKEAKSFEYAANEQVKRKTNAVDKCIFSIEKYLTTIIG